MSFVYYHDRGTVEFYTLSLHDALPISIVVLKDAQGTAVLPIWVGIYEANAIALEIEKVQTPRPMTHDLLRNVFLGLRSEEHTSELQSHVNLVCRLLLEKKNK